MGAKVETREGVKQPSRKNLCTRQETQETQEMRETRNLLNLHLLFFLRTFAKSWTAFCRDRIAPTCTIRHPVLCQNSDSHDIPKRRSTALGDVANTDIKLLICSLFQKSRVLAQDAVRHGTTKLRRPREPQASWLQPVFSTRHDTTEEGPAGEWRSTPPRRTGSWKR